MRRLIGTLKRVWIGGLSKLSKASLMFLLALKLAKLRTLMIKGEVLLAPSAYPKHVTPFALPPYPESPLI